jgi:Cu/Ag efflux protein CusF
MSGTAVAGDHMPGAGHDHMMGMTTAKAGAEQPATDGVIRGIDRKASTLTVQHGPIPSLGMAAMTMPYRVKDRAMLDAVKAGDKIRMSVAIVGGTYTITSLERLQ